MTNIKNPNAAVIIWTYKNRLDHHRSNNKDIHKVEEIILATSELIDIRTSKSKSSPNGTFSFTLAPTKNWVSFIAPGSWCAVLMTNSKLLEVNLDDYVATEDELKYLGRISSVRVNVGVDQNGTRHTSYICEGEDWGSIFNSTVYLDLAAREMDSNVVGTAMAMLYANMVQSVVSGETTPPTSTTNVKTLVQLWGKNSNYVAKLREVFEAAGGDNSQTLISSEALFKIPKEVQSFLGQATDNMSKLVCGKYSYKTGILTGPDTYKESHESIGVIDPTTINGAHSLWSLMKDNCNEIVNELFCDLRWEDEKWQLALYKRVKPFITTPLLSQDGISSSVSSRFEYVRKVEIPKDHVIAFDAGTNWRDKLNFVEILPNAAYLQSEGATESLATLTKSICQKADNAAFGREGFKGALYTTTYFPPGGGGVISIEAMGSWAKVLGQWYFNSHNYLNGTIEFIGQDMFIGVGDNLMIDAGILGPTPNMNMAQLNSKEPTYLLLHVETLSHKFSSNLGARHWTTTVSFTRGILCNNEGSPLNITAIDEDSSLMSPEQEKNSYNILTTNTSKADPDVKNRRLY